jgi:hypothetical protein
MCTSTDILTTIKLTRRRLMRVFSMNRREENLNKSDRLDYFDEGGGILLKLILNAVLGC